MGEFLALGVSLEHLSEKYHDKKCKILAETLDKATEKLLLENKSPTRKLGGLDNRGSHFYIAFYWSELLSKQTEDIELANFFTKIFNYLTINEKVINDELIETQNKEHNIDGYYLTDDELTNAAMCPSKTLNKIYSEF
ncbi:MAG: Isocitrate dehydrogenase [NADP] [Crocinitomicaceae bacterium]|nr:MAG: Isocitrate dehydrogenase [NADP] [Crocinitomicaceae bacterium]